MGAQLSVEDMKVFFLRRSPGVGRQLLRAEDAFEQQGDGIRWAADYSQAMTWRELLIVGICENHRSLREAVNRRQIQWQGKESK